MGGFNLGGFYASALKSGHFSILKKVLKCVYFLQGCMMIKIFLLVLLIFLLHSSFAAQENYFAPKTEMMTSSEHFLYIPKKSLVNRRRQGRPEHGSTDYCRLCDKGDLPSCAMCPEYLATSTSATTTTTTTTTTTQKPRSSTEALFDQIYDAINSLGFPPLQDLLKTQIGLVQWLFVNVF